MKKHLLGLILPLLFLTSCCMGCHAAPSQSSPSPEDSFRELQLAVQAGNRDKIETLVDLDRFLEQSYDISASEMSKDILILHQRYPEDPFFWHDTAFMDAYTKEHRSVSLNFIRDILTCYFSGETPAETYDEAPTSWLSGELAKLYEASTAELKDIRRTADGHATAVILLKGDGTPYGSLTDGIRLELNLEQQEDGRWKFTGIGNIPDLILPVADKAEMFWTLQGWQ